MEYISNGEYKINLNGQEVIVSANDLRDAFLDVKKYEGEEINTNIETCPPQYIYEYSAKYELLREEIKDSGYKNLEWNSDVESVLDTAIESAMDTAYNWFTSKYYMEKKI